jgi:hypothetical protein
LSQRQLLKTDGQDGTLRNTFQLYRPNNPAFPGWLVLKTWFTGAALLAKAARALVWKRPDKVQWNSYSSKHSCYLSAAEYYLVTNTIFALGIYRIRVRIHPKRRASLYHVASISCCIQHCSFKQMPTKKKLVRNLQLTRSGLVLRLAVVNLASTEVTIPVRRSV